MDVFVCIFLHQIKPYIAIAIAAQRRHATLPARDDRLHDARVQNPPFPYYWTIGWVAPSTSGGVLSTRSPNHGRLGLGLHRLDLHEVGDRACGGTKFFRADSIARRDASSKVSHGPHRPKLEFPPLFSGPESAYK